MAPGDASGAEKSSKKSKKRRREGDHGSSGSGGTGGEKRASSSREVVLRCAAADSVSPIVVSFANQTVPEDMGEVEFQLHEGHEEEGREGQKLVIGESGRWVGHVCDRCSCSCSAWEKEHSCGSAPT